MGWDGHGIVGRWPYHGVTFPIHRGRSLNLFSTIATGGGFSPSSANSSRVIPSFYFRVSHISRFRNWRGGEGGQRNGRVWDDVGGMSTWSAFDGLLFLCRGCAWRGLAGEVHDVADILKAAHYVGGGWGVVCVLWGGELELCREGGFRGWER